MTARSQSRDNRKRKKRFADKRRERENDARARGEDPKNGKYRPNWKERRR